MVGWVPPPDETSDAIVYDVLLGGATEMDQNKTVTNGDNSFTFTGLPPFTTYIVTVRTVDITAEVSSPPSPSIECNTSTDLPSLLQYLDSEVVPIDTTTLALRIFWQRPAIINGDFRNYTFVWGNLTDNVVKPSCQERYQAAEQNMLVITDYNMTSATEADSDTTAIISQANMLQLCGRVANSDFTSEWLEDVEAIAGSLTTPGDESSSTALIAVIVLATISITVALVIAFILGIAVYLRHNKRLTPGDTIDGMQSDLPSKHNHLHPGNIQRTPSTKPIVENESNSDTS